MPATSQPLVFQLTSEPIRFGAAVLVAIISYLITFPLETEVRLLIAYDLAMITYLAFVIVRIAHADGNATRDLAEKKETSNLFMLSLAGIFSGCSLAGVGIMLHRSQAWTPFMANVHLILSLAAVFLSWTLLHVLFGIHYARLYYDPPPPPGESGRKPLEFPAEELPDFWDFLYFAFTLAVCYQVSDVTIYSRHLRRVALAHMFLSFLNVTMILGLVVGIVSALANPAVPKP